MKKLLVTFISLLAAFAVSAEENSINLVSADRGEAAVSDNVKPLVKSTSKDGKYTITVGGNVHMKASYDFNGSIDNPDFIPSIIAVPGAYDTQRRFYMDASTSRVDITGSAQTEKFGEVEVCATIDLRGGAVGSYTPRMRLIYVNVAGFTVGRNYSTFCDLNSMAPNIDFQGPNSCPFAYTAQIRYVKNVANDRLTLGGAVEYATYESCSLGEENALSPSGQTFCYQKQYMPDFIGYLQLNWGNNSHTRVSGLYKNIPLYNSLSEQNESLNGWGTQLSGLFGICDKLQVYYSAIAGEGITNYLQDAYGSGLDATVSGGVDPQARITFMYGWQASTLFQISERTMMSTGYSTVKIQGASSKFVDGDYRRGEYLFANIFHNITPRVQVSAEYLWGKRTNNNGDSSNANRIFTMIQYNF